MNGIFYGINKIVTIKQSEYYTDFYEVELYLVDEDMDSASVSLDSICTYMSFNQLDNYECYTEVSEDEVMELVNDLLY